MRINVADLFCGGGGETTGIVQAAQEAGLRINLAAVNHWRIAIETHQMNYPQARAYCQDLATLNPLDVFGAREKLNLLWASPECTHHSVARGGRPRSEQGRASAWLILKWLSELYVRRVILENVPEFLHWGPLGADGKPLKSQKGKTFQAFTAALQALGYKVEWRLLCAADYGDPTTRTRLFLQAVRGGSRILWPEPTHSRAPSLLGEKAWIPAREIIDWSIRGESIFNRRRPLAPATLRRIAAGIRRYWGEWAEPFLLMLTHGGRAISANGPLPTVTAAHRGEIGIVQPFLAVLRGTSVSRESGEPLPTVTAGGGHFGLVEPFLVPHYGEREGQEPRTHAIGEPCPTVPASGGGKFGVVEPFILHQMSPGRPRRMSEPLPTITTESGHALVEPFILSAGGPECPARPISQPAGTILTRDHRAVVQPFIVPYYGTGVPDRVDDPLAAVTGKDRFALVDGEPVCLDITFRMLQPHELAAAQGFPREYRFAGNKGDQVRQIGNAVPVNTARALALGALCG